MTPDEFRKHKRDYMRKWYQGNKDKVSGYLKKARTQNPNKFKIRANLYRVENSEKIKESRRRFYEKNKESIKQKVYKYRSENMEKCRKSTRDSSFKWRSENPLKAKQKIQNHIAKNPILFKQKQHNRALKESTQLTDSYISKSLGIKVRDARKYPDLIEAKREQIKILRELKPTNRKQTQCTRIQPTCNKSATTSQKPLTRHGLTSLLSIELSSWSTPWVRQLTQLLLKSKRPR